jgi:hypothetical protein
VLIITNILQKLCYQETVNLFMERCRLTFVVAVYVPQFAKTKISFLIIKSLHLLILNKWPQLANSVLFSGKHIKSLFFSSMSSSTQYRSSVSPIINSCRNKLNHQFTSRISLMHLDLIGEIHVHIDAIPDPGGEFQLNF